MYKSLPEKSKESEFYTTGSKVPNEFFQKLSISR